MRKSSGFVALALTIGLLLNFSGITLGGEASKDSETEKKSLLQDHGSSISAKLDKLLKEAKSCKNNDNRTDNADSLLLRMVSLAEQSYDNRLIVITYNHYLDCMNEGNASARAVVVLPKLEKALDAMQDDSLRWWSCINISDVFSNIYQYGRALEYAYKSLTYAESINDPEVTARSYIRIGIALKGKNQNIEAFRNYLQALNLAEESGAAGILRETYNALSRFFHLNRDFNKAIAYKLKEAAIVRELQPVDSTDLMWIRRNLEEISYNSMNLVNEENIYLILEYAIRNKKENLKYETLNLFRNYLINSNQPAKLEALYFEDYPADLGILFKEMPAIYYRVMSIINEYKGRMDSAYHYLKLGAIAIEKESNTVLAANYYTRIGQFLKRYGRQQEAIGYFQLSFRMAKEAGYLQYQLQAAAELEKTYSDLGDFKNAYTYASLNHELGDSLQKVAKKDDLLLLEIDNEAKVRELNLRRQEEEKQKRYNLQYMAITIVMGLVFLMLLMVGSFRVPQWLIQMLGFVSFIMLFEFIVLILDTWIHHITHGEPWKILAIKMIIIGIMMPVHHYTEHRVTHYLMTHKLLRFSRFSIKKILRDIFVRPAPPAKGSVGE